MCGRLHCRSRDQGNRDLLVIQPFVYCPISAYSYYHQFTNDSEQSN